MVKMILLSMAVLAMFGGATSHLSQGELAGAPGHKMTLTDCTAEYAAQQELGDPSTDHDIRQVRIQATDEFIVASAANVDRDPEPDTWSMRDNKELRNDINDVAD